MYIADSVAHGMTPVFPYYMLLQSNPATGADEKARDLSNLANTSTMAAYYTDLRLFFTRAAGPTPVVLHVEPDLWGYIEQDASRTDDARACRPPSRAPATRSWPASRTTPPASPRRSSACATRSPRT